MEDITAIILTKNEEKNISECIDSISDFVKRIVLIDSGSTDATIQIAKEKKVDIFFHEFENYSKQFNWALDNSNIDTKWTLRIDADERFTPQLCDKLSQMISEHENDDVNGIVLESWLVFMGKIIKHGCHNKRKLMVFKSGIGRIEDRKMDEHTILLDGHSIPCEERFIHYDYKDLSHWIHKLNWYATREMQDYFDYINGTRTTITDDPIIKKVRKKKYGFYYRLPLFLRSTLLFVYYYVFRLGFLDGKEGFVYHWMYHRWYRTLVDAKILEQKLFNRPFEKTGDLK